MSIEDVIMHGDWTLRWCVLNTPPPYEHEWRGLWLGRCQGRNDVVYVTPPVARTQPVNDREAAKQRGLTAIVTALDS